MTDERDKIVLVTGGAGFIGSELVRLLAARFAKVVVVDNLINGRRENIAELLDDRVQLVAADIRDGNALANTISGVEIIFHLACLGVHIRFTRLTKIMRSMPRQR